MRRVVYDLFFRFPPDTLLFLAFRWCCSSGLLCFALLHSWALMRSAIRKKICFFFPFHLRAAMAGAVAETDGSAVSVDEPEGT